MKKYLTLRKQMSEEHLQSLTTLFKLQLNFVW